MQGYFFVGVNKVYYIIFDLEWNNVYNYAVNGYMNEIIEIGAVKLDEQLNIVDTFKQLVKPENFKRLSSRCKSLTKITNEEIKENGIPFDRAIRDFARWSEGEKSVFLSWSNSDLYVLTHNFKNVLGTLKINFMTRYCDAQKYCMSFLDRNDNNQISLANCAEIMQIDVDTEKLHRALADCYLTAECVKKVFDKDKLKSFTSVCDSSFFERLMYKPYYITEPKSSLFDLSKVEIKCPVCDSTMKPIKKFESVNKTFRGPVKCCNCKKAYWAYIRAKKTYDEVIVSVSTVEMNKKRAKKFKQACADK
jgi:inhibitor of KinA sporulation pathway (predicted exonuclease)